jgi:nicotinamidase-related amidase
VERLNPKSFENPQKALLVIDIQEDYTGSTATPPFPYKDSEKLIQTVNRLIEKAAQDGMVIVYIRQEFAGFGARLIAKMLLNGRSIQGNPGTEIDHRIKIISDNIFPKPMASGFSNPNLEKFLDGQEINELYLVGLDAQFCVHATGKAAVKRGYQASIIKGAIAVRNEDRWEKLFKDYDRDSIKLIESKEF